MIHQQRGRHDRALCLGAPASLADRREVLAETDRVAVVRRRGFVRFLLAGFAEGAVARLHAALQAEGARPMALRDKKNGFAFAKVFTDSYLVLFLKRRFES